jgi:hypothetical protein
MSHANFTCPDFAAAKKRVPSVCRIAAATEIGWRGRQSVHGNCAARCPAVVPAILPNTAPFISPVPPG